MGAKILSWGAEFSERYKTAENWAENSIFNIVKLNKSIGHHSDFYFSAVCKCICHHWRNNIFYRHRACLARAEMVELVTLSTKQRITTAFAHSKILLEKTAKTVSIADLVTQISLHAKKDENECNCKRSGFLWGLIRTTTNILPIELRASIRK